LDILDKTPTPPVFPILIRLGVGGWEVEEGRGRSPINLAFLLGPKVPIGHQYIESSRWQRAHSHRPAQSAEIDSLKLFLPRQPRIFEGARFVHDVGDGLGKL